MDDNVIFSPETVSWSINHNSKSDITAPYNGDDVDAENIIEDNVGWVCGQWFYRGNN